MKHVKQKFRNIPDNAFKIISGFLSEREEGGMENEKSENDTISGVCKSATIIPPIREIETTVGGVRATLLHLVATERETRLKCRE